MKSVAVLRPGARVTLVIPRTQRRWSRLGYGARSGVITLQACRHLKSREARRRERGSREAACATDPTLFAGGFGVDFDHAPKRGRCAELIVWVQGMKRPLRERLFAPRGCAPTSPSGRE
jgi:hypothetical protein